MNLNEANLLFNAIRACQGCFRPLNVVPPVRFSYLLAKNAAALLPEVRAAQDAVNADLDVEMLKRHEFRRQVLANDPDGDAKLAEEFPRAADDLAMQLARATEIG